MSNSEETFIVGYVGRHDCGEGLRAGINLDAGTRLLVESPLYTTSVNFLTDTPTEERESFVKQAFEQLPTHIREIAMELPNMEPFHLIQHPQLTSFTTQYSGIVKSNAIPYSLDRRAGGAERIGIFPTLSRINHSCHPNAQQTWNSELRAVTIHAFRDIAVNEEITISYAPEAIIDEKYLKDKYNFACSCEWCLAPAEVRAESNNNRAEIVLRNEHLHNMIKAGLSEQDQGLAILAAKQLFTLLRTENIVDWRLGRLYLDCFDIVAERGNKQRGKIFAVLAFHVFDHCEGLDSDNVRRIKMRMEKLFGISKCDEDFLDWMEDIEKEWKMLKRCQGGAILDWLFWKEIWPKS
ncbi:uncharacterized protein BP5553_01839 [Venustampulla echinocandica]|uniref:SET domain-containing protein n=1 Tax=Venustampulla echinocandica TaxID=2656787 RepID=A0A370U253_9HELO|nr:uncharacterized protein BP5553_01839 [Venustampulla echinocandica]RDL41860.1 hypothetical protein BP5553_01839 [Venustampulla echinocandica]